LLVNDNSEEVARDISADKSLVNTNSADIARDSSASTSTILLEISAERLAAAVAVNPVIAPFKSPSADWKAATISVNESIATGSTLEVIKSIWFCKDKSPATL